MNLWGRHGAQLEVPASDSTFREFCFSGLMCVRACVCVCVCVCVEGGKRRLVRGWVEILNCSLPVEDDLRE